MNLFLIIFLTVVLIASMYIDILSQRIPNIITIPAILTGVLSHGMFQGISGLIYSMEGLVLGVLLLIVPYLLGGMGAGDVKLMGAVGSVLGPTGVFGAVLLTALIGGLYGLAALAYHAAKNKSLRKGSERPCLCYGVAISLGTMITVFYPIVNK